jgi:hypothetical protein
MTADADTMAITTTAISTQRQVSLLGFAVWLSGLTSMSVPILDHPAPAE